MDGQSMSVKLGQEVPKPRHQMPDHDRPDWVGEDPVAPYPVGDPAGQTDM